MPFYREKFRKIRKDLRWKTTQIAKECGVSRQSVCQWESGRANPSEEHIRKLARVLSVSLSEISTFKDEVPTSDLKIAAIMNTVHSFASATTEKIHKDYTELVRRAQKQWKNMEQASIVVKAILGAIPSIFYVKDSRGKYVVVSQAFKDNIKLVHTYTILGKEDKDFFPKEAAAQNAEEDLGVIRTGKPVKDREGYIPGSRKKKWGLISKTPIFENDKIVGVLGHMVDITEKKETEIIQHLITKCIDKLDVSLAVININKKSNVYINQECRKVFGIEEGVPSEKLHEYWQNNIVHPDDRERQIEATNKIYEGKIPENRKYRIVHPDKGIRTIKVHSIQSLKFLDEEYAASLSIDITEKNERKK